MSDEQKGVVVKTPKDQTAGVTHQNGNAVKVVDGHLYVFDGHGISEPGAVYAPGSWHSATVNR